MGSFPDYPWIYPTSPRLLDRYGFQATELKIRNLALHLALCVRRDGSRLVLRKRYGDRQKIGAYRTWEAVNRALEKYLVEQARLLGTYVATPCATAELVPPV
jgi:hypothetical protein